jgi:hypothetical protein
MGMDQINDKIINIGFKYFVLVHNQSKGITLNDIERFKVMVLN